MDDRGQDADKWLTLTEAATRTGYTRDALRQRIRRGKLPSIKGNDGIVRIAVRDLADLPPPDESTDVYGPTEQAVRDTTMDLMIASMDDLRTALAHTRADLVQAQTTLGSALDESRIDHGRAERAEAQAAAEAARATLAEARLASTEAALTEARTPWAIRVLRAIRR